jgi:tRNA pseudouridine38-40 synthase
VTSPGEDFYLLRIRGSGFLKQMVRLIMGTLVNVGKSKINATQVENSLRLKLEDKLGPVVPAEGLYLSHVHYS